MADKITAILGFAVKGRKLVYGIDNIEACKGRIYGIFFDAGLSERSQKNIAFIAAKKNAVLLESVKPIESVTGKKNCKAAALTDVNMHKGIMDALENGNEEYKIMKIEN